MYVHITYYNKSQLFNSYKNLNEGYTNIAKPIKSPILLIRNIFVLWNV